MVRLNAEIFGVDVLTRKLDLLGEHATNLEPLFDSLADDFHALNRRQFSSQGGNSGGWAPLAPSTERERIRDGFPPGPALQRTGALEASLTQSSATGSVQQISNESLFVGSDVFYAHFHQTGTKNMPRRRPVQFTQGDKNRWVKALQRFILTGDPEVGL